MPKVGYKQTVEHKAKTRVNNPGHTGHTHSELTRERIRKSLKGRKIPGRNYDYLRGKKQSEEHKAKNRKWHVENFKPKFKDTSIELAIQEELINRHILFYKQFPIGGYVRVDFFLPEFNAIVECDGCYWHGCALHRPNNNQERIEKDARQSKEILKRGYILFRFWEHDIKKSPKECVDIIEKGQKSSPI